MCRSETGEQHALPLAAEHHPREPEHIVWEQHASQQPRQMSRCHGAPVLLVFEDEIASVRATFEVFGVGRLSGSSSIVVAAAAHLYARTGDAGRQASPSHGRRRAWLADM